MRKQKSNQLIFTKNAAGNYEFMDLSVYNNSLSRKSISNNKDVQAELKYLKNILNKKQNCSSCSKRRKY